VPVYNVDVFYPILYFKWTKSTTVNLDFMGKIEELTLDQFQAELSNKRDFTPS